MKKVLMLASVLLFTVPSFALNAVSQDVCQPGKTVFAQLTNEDAIVRHLLSAADAFDKLTDAQALPAAACYATYQVKGQSLSAFVDTIKNDYRNVVISQLRSFAQRVEGLTQQIPADVCHPGKEAFEQGIADLDYYDFAIIQHILTLANSLESVNDDQALPVAACYTTYNVQGQSLVDFIHTNKADCRNVVTKQLNAFEYRLKQLSR